MDYVTQGSTSATVGSQFCSYCKRLLGKGVQVVRELKQVGHTGQLLSTTKMVDRK